MPQFTIVADKNLCIGAGQCVMVAPDLFTQDEEDGLVVVKVDAASGQILEDAQFAITSCPTRALSLLASSDA